MLKAVIFDFDGVITDSEVLHYRTFNQVLAPFGIRITQKNYYKHFLGLSDKDLFTLFKDKGMLKTNEKGIAELIKRKNRYFEELAKAEGKIIEGVRDFLGRLKKSKIRIAICSGALLPEIELILDDSKLRSYFETIVSAEMVEKGKPDPEGFLMALGRMNENGNSNIVPDECVVIEDSRWGLDAAKAAGMHPVAITNSYEAEDLAMAEKIIGHLDELVIDDLEQLCS